MEIDFKTISALKYEIYNVIDTAKREGKYTKYIDEETSEIIFELFDARNYLRNNQFKEAKEIVERSFNTLTLLQGN